METAFQIREITELTEMVQQLPLIQSLNPSMTEERFEQLLQQMVANQYRMVGVFTGDACVGLSGFWISTKLYSGKYLEIDNFVVSEQYRSQKLGKKLVDWLVAEAERNLCETVMLDAYVVNSAAHRFYYREGFEVKGFHFLRKTSLSTFS